MTEFIPEKKGTILSIAVKINHLHVICTNQFFCADIGAMAIIAVNISSIKENGVYELNGGFGQEFILSSLALF